jgi:hypothetical protein
MRPQEEASLECIQELKEPTKQYLRKYIGELTDKLIDNEWEGWKGKFEVNGWKIKLSISIENPEGIVPF